MQLGHQAICDQRDLHKEVFTHINIYADLINAEYVTGPLTRILNRANICINIYTYIHKYVYVYIPDILLFFAATRRLLRQHFGLL